MSVMHYNSRSQCYEGERLAVDGDIFARALAAWVAEDQQLAAKFGMRWDESIAYQRAWEIYSSESAWDESMPGVALLRRPVELPARNRAPHAASARGADARLSA